METSTLGSGRTERGTVKVRSHGPCGYKYVGEWKDDKLRKGTEYDKDGSVTAIFPEGLKTLAN